MKISMSSMYEVDSLNQYSNNAELVACITVLFKNVLHTQKAYKQLGMFLHTLSYPHTHTVAECE